MEVYLVVRRQKCSICLEAKDSWTVTVVKQQIEGILTIPVEKQRLYKDDVVLEDTKTLSECGLNSSNAKAQSPAVLFLSCLEGDEFEAVSITEYSQPPELPDVMKPHPQAGTPSTKTE